MSENLEFLLSDEFITFSQQVKAVHEKKKTLKSEFKVLYDKFNADIKALDDEAQRAQVVFERWKMLQEPKNKSEKVASEKGA